MKIMAESSNSPETVSPQQTIAAIQLYCLIIIVAVVSAKIAIPWFDASVRWWAVIVGLLIPSAVGLFVRHPSFATMFLKHAARDHFDKTFFEAVDGKIQEPSLNLVLTGYQVTGPTTARLHFRSMRDLPEDLEEKAQQRFQAYLTAVIPAAAFTGSLSYSRAGLSDEKIAGVPVPTWKIQGFSEPVLAYKVLYVFLETNFLSTLATLQRVNLTLTVRLHPLFWVLPRCAPVYRSNSCSDGGHSV